MTSAILTLNKKEDNSMKTPSFNNNMNLTITLYISSYIARCLYLDINMLLQTMEGSIAF